MGLTFLLCKMNIIVRRFCRSWKLAIPIPSANLKCGSIHRDICTDGIICPWDISGQSLLTVGNILDDSWFNGTSTKPTVNLNSSPGSPATMKLGSIILLHWALKVSFLHYVVRSGTLKNRFICFVLGYSRAMRCSYSIIVKNTIWKLGQIT